MSSEGTSKTPRFFAADAHRDGKRAVVRADEVMSAFWELEAATRVHLVRKLTVQPSR